MSIVKTGLLDPSAANGFTKTYWFVTNSTNAAIAHVGGAGDTYLTNNALGSDTSSYNPNSRPVLWDPSTNKFVFTSLKIGDVVTVTGVVLFDNLAAQEVDMFISMSEGTASAHEHKINHSYYKTAGTDTQITFSYEIFMHDAHALAGGARIRFESVQAASITVDTWSAKVTSV